ncbi:DUF6350 family protein [Actinomadura rayongensis]|uniref:Integral membrane protein n=1 Tax=Actinomadura rayongensis TaxID=1429076 RepID=A0A6I4W4P4_9ACTN|nr:DUF6350 family protein [Actinomadura rayongensis]MXQ64411.1 hypothetical protein [Actinomadura rayongensis]
MSDMTRERRTAPDRAGTQRPLLVTGLVGAVWCVGIGLAVLVTVTLVGWIAAPRSALGTGLPGVFRTAVTFWLVAHHAGLSLPDGRVGLLPLGVVALPGALLYRCGGWMLRTSGRRTRRGVVDVAVALAVPYTLFAGLLALAATKPPVRPSPWQALLCCFTVALVAGGLGAARGIVARRGRVRSGLGALLRLLPERPRSLVVGVSGALAVLLAAGALLVGVALAFHLPEANRLYGELAPGVVGGVLLLVVELAFLPNAIIWGTSYAVGAGFAVGTGTSVSVTGVFLDTVPAFPPLAALPDPGPAPALSLLALAAPFAAGAVGGVLTVRALPSPAAETAPLWGFTTGALTGLVLAALAALSGGPMGGGRLRTVGPSPWQVGLLAALEVGVAAALAAWLANGRALRRTGEPKPRRRRRPPRPPRDAAPVLLTEPLPDPVVPLPAPEPAPKPVPAVPDPLEFEDAEPVLPARRTRPPEPEPDEPRPRDDRTENRGGAIFVLRDEADD